MTGLVALFTFCLYLAIRYVLVDPHEAWPELLAGAIAITIGVFASAWLGGVL